MARDFRSARFWAEDLLEEALYPGARAIDATMGNGRDTRKLCQWVGETGRVYAFDVQPAAVERTRALLESEGLSSQAELFCVGHERMAEFVREPVDAVVFNLGWLPGAGHGVTTLAQTTLRAVEAALDLLTEEGLLTICVYPGHEEGCKELKALLEWASKLDETRYDAMLKRYLNPSNHPPQLIAVKRKPQKRGREHT